MNMQQVRQIKGDTHGSTLGHLWYMQSGGRVRGPFPAGAIGRYIQRGELGASDALSRDRKHWRQVRELAQFAQWLSRREDDAAAQLARLRLPLNTDYRLSAPWFESGAAHANVAPSARPTPAAVRERVWPQLLIGAALLAAVAWLAIRHPTPLDTAGIQCDAAAAARVNWDGCHKQGAALAHAVLDHAILNNANLQQANRRAARLHNATLIFAQLSGANLSYADLRGASLLGAQMQGADLSSANLQGADLSYADLSDAGLGGADLAGAKLDHAVWWDSSVCAAGSVGECLGPSLP